MSSAGSISGAGQGLYQFLQKVSRTQGGQGAGGPRGAGGPPPGDGPPPGGGAHHPHGGKDKALFSKIESAVTDALNNSSDDSDAEQTVQDAISKVLNGDDSSSTTSSSSATTTSTDSTTSTDGTQQADDQSSREAFFQTLKDHGIDPEQFRQDLMSALKQARSNGGQIDREQAFASVPAGVAVDVAA